MKIFVFSVFILQDSGFILFCAPSPPEMSGAWGGEMGVRPVSTSVKMRFWRAEHAPGHFAKNALNSTPHKG
jgi:hypothetical protein